MCEITESESMERRLDSLAAENEELKAEVDWLNNDRYERKAEADHLRGRPAVCVAVIVRDDEGRVLLLRRSATRTFPGTWCLPGGRLDCGESLHDCCRRELVEETGLIAGRFAFDVVTEVGGPPHLIGLVYEASCVTGTAVNAEPHAHDAIGFFGLDALPSPLMPGVVAWLGPSADHPGPDAAPAGGVMIRTPEQYELGYAVPCSFPIQGGTPIRREPYRLIRRLPDGNYLVEDPSASGPADEESK